MSADIVERLNHAAGEQEEHGDGCLGAPTPYEVREAAATIAQLRELVREAMPVIETMKRYMPAGNRFDAWLVAAYKIDITERAGAQLGEKP